MIYWPKDYKAVHILYHGIVQNTKPKVHMNSLQESERTTLNV